MTSSEKRILIGVFGGAAFVVANFFLYGIVQEKKAAVVQKHTVLDARIFQLEELRKEKDEWQSKRAWVMTRLPVYTSVNDRETFLISLVNNAASAAALEIVNGPNQIPGSQGDYFEETGVSATVKGNIEGVVRWIYSMQDPDAFRAVTSVKIDAAKRDSSEITCEVTVVQWWSPSSEAYAAAGEGPASPAVDPGVPETPVGDDVPDPATTDTSSVTDATAASVDAPADLKTAIDDAGPGAATTEGFPVRETASARTDGLAPGVPARLTLPPLSSAPNPNADTVTPSAAPTRATPTAREATASAQAAEDQDEEEQEEEMAPAPARRVVLPPSAR